MKMSNLSFWKSTKSSLVAFGWKTLCIAAGHLYLLHM